MAPLPYRLPDLPYDYGALQPHISGEIMEIHHGKHHKAYVEKANETLERIDDARAKHAFSESSALQRVLSFNVSGHVLHSTFWKNLTPKGGGAPAGELGRCIERDFGSFEQMKAQLTEVAASLMGSGWAALVWEPTVARLQTESIHDHHSNVTQGASPLMVIDGWEHAYYLQYKNQKQAFFEAVWNLWNWDDIQGRFDAARGHEGEMELKAATAGDGPAENHG